MDMETIQRSDSIVLDILSLDLLEALCARFHEGTAAVFLIVWILGTALFWMGCLGPSSDTFRAG